MEIELKNNHQGGGLKRLKCSVQNYDWGKKGTEGSEVARLYELNSGSDIELEKKKPFAEFWMGTHGSGPSFVVEGGVENGDSIGSGSMSLKEWICKNPNVLGEKVLDKWGCDLPFLFKVLSVAKALSIQAHPDKELAKVLNKLHPNLYKDDNHKPEMALAVTEFEALCSFISLEELKSVLRDVPEIVELVGSAEVNKLLQINEHGHEEKVKSGLRSAFTQLMSASKEMTAEVISNLKGRLYTESKIRQLTGKEQLVLQLEKQYPADIGVVSAFFLNYVKLNPGEALYIGANEPHAYLYGECIECMATSDNVVRAGLTPKNLDIQALCSMLTYKQGFPEILQGFPLSPYITRYLPPFDEFEVDRCILPRGAATVFPAIPGPSIFLLTAGEGKMCTESSKDVVMEGDVLFAPANTEISVSTTSELHLYRAGVNSRFFQIL
ncbi:mannose-6-phosphate isomerase [Salix suchowensis]|uniref:mannose-6-phosphate isomerase n=1 Tax=Salix koriyanagi TaxID=2511006 RepID=A0A9Q0VQF8_9ROSI|nr:mannose-6-phosphate isomerase [Salix suchowensis]KAJ6752889.1 MANNOSE-6-PHOSPHATE ISOMERASE [Salix koriyanagi]